MAIDQYLDRVPTRQTQKEAMTMTMPSPILASALVLAATAALALCSMVLNAGRRSLIRVRTERNRNTKAQG